MRQIAVLAGVLPHGSDVLSVSAVATPMGSTRQAARPSFVGARSVPGTATDASDGSGDRSSPASIADHKHVVPGGEHNPVVPREVHHVGHEHGLWWASSGWKREDHTPRDPRAFVFCLLARLEEVEDDPGNRRQLDKHGLETQQQL